MCGIDCKSFVRRAKVAVVSMGSTHKVRFCTGVYVLGKHSKDITCVFGIFTESSSEFLIRVSI